MSDLYTHVEIDSLHEFRPRKREWGKTFDHLIPKGRCLGGGWCYTFGICKGFSPPPPKKKEFQIWEVFHLRFAKR